MKVLDLFSGIGGFSLAAHWAGFETAAFCEFEPYCQKVLAKNFPGIPIYDDVRTLTRERMEADGIGTIDVICGGYPCQPFSLAGQRRGTEDDRHLWPEMFRLVKEFRPIWVLGENVAGHVSMGLDEVLFDLESLGYASRPLVIPACAVDAPHRRDRVWIVANSEGEGKRGEIRNICQANGGQGPALFQQPISTGKTTFAKKTPLADTTNARVESLHQWEEPTVNWPTEPAVGRMAYGIPRRVDRLKALGNAIVPQLAFEILKAMAKVEKNSI